MNYMTLGEISRILVLMSSLDNIETACKETGVEDTVVSFKTTVSDANGETLGTVAFNPTTRTHVFTAHAETGL